MKHIRIRIINLLDQHSESFNTCPGCLICTEIQQLSKLLEREPTKKYKWILNKGPDMRKSDIEFLLDNQVPKDVIRNSLGLTKGEFWELMDNFGLLKNDNRRKKAMSKISQEMYQDFKAQGLSDKKIAVKVNINPQYLSQLKRKWNIKTELKESISPSETFSQPKESNNKIAEYESLINELRSRLSDKDGQLAVKESMVKNLEMKVTEYEKINAACEDVKEEIANLRTKLEQERNERKRAEDNAKTSLLESSRSLLKHNHEIKALKELLRLYL